MAWGLRRVRRVRFAAVRLCVAAVVLGLFTQCGSSEEHVAPPGGNAGAGTSGRGGSDSGRGGASGTSAGSGGLTGSSGAGPDASTGGTAGMDAGDGDVSVDGEHDASPDGDRDAAPDGDRDAAPDSPDADITLVDRCPGTLTPATVNALRAGGPAADMKWLYPYDRTVFPRGILPPVVQWSGRTAEAVLLVVKAKNYEYRGCFGATNPLRIAIPADVWTNASTAGSGPGEPVTVALTTLSAGVVTGPITQGWTIASAALPGLVYYSTYGSPQSANNGAVMRLRPGAARPDVYLTEPGLAPLGPCKSCHSVSANGNRLVADRYSFPAGPYESFSYNVTTSTNPPPLGTTTLDGAGFAALLPDGSRFLTNGSPGTTMPIPFPNGPGNVTGTTGPRTSRLFDTATGQPVQVSGWSVQYAKMPSFAPDGARLVFNNHDVGQGRSLSLMDFNSSTNTFSNHVEIFRHDTLFPGWPAFLPNGRGVVFALGAASDYVSSHPARLFPEVSDLYYVDLATKTSVRLSSAGGFNGNTSYLPYPGRDERWEYFPTVAPVSSGGYAWLFFTSRRNYGNTRVAPDPNPVEVKLIWVAAIDLNAPAGADPSHPAFILDGQEIGSGNFRPVVALEP